MIKNVMSSAKIIPSNASQSYHLHLGYILAHHGCIYALYYNLYSSVLDSLRTLLAELIFIASLLSYEPLYYSSYSRMHLLPSHLESVAFAACLHGLSHICILRCFVQDDVPFIWLFRHQIKCTAIYLQYYLMHLLLAI